ncbi:Subtilisin-like protease SBT1.7 [Forsythia ovata]|uniref:Subtilisin-like protease SBT1.7 n=1 Tax=Forsythia ovata TaxID=205694 RepID=A0ABD1P3Y4_9LAMI
MEIKIKVFKFSALGILVLLGLCHVSFAAKKNVLEKNTYIVHMAKSEMPASFEDHTHWYDSSLKSMSDSAEMLYTYTNVIHGFSSRLMAKEAGELENRPEHLEHHQSDRRHMCNRKSVFVRLK